MCRLRVRIERFIVFVSIFSFSLSSFWWVQSQLPPILSHKTDGRLGPSRSNCSARCRKSFDFAAMSFSMFSPVRVQRFRGYASHPNSMVIKMLGYLHYTCIHQICNMLRMLTYSSLILILFILPEVKDFGNPKRCDIINSGRSSESQISDSLSQCLILLD